MQVVNGNLELKERLHFGRPNFIIFDRTDNCYKFYIDHKLVDFQICTTGTGIGDIDFNDLSVSSLVVGSTAVINGLLTTNELLVSSGATFCDDVTIKGSLNVLGGITSISSTETSITGPLIFLADGNVTDINDIGFYGQYSDGVTRFTGLFRDTSDANKKFKLFDGVTSKPSPNFVDNEIDLNLADLQLNNICVEGFAMINEIGVTSLGVTGDANINTLFSNEIGVTSLGVTGDANINTLFSNEIGVTSLGVTGNALIDGGVTINSFLDVNGDSNFLNITGTNMFLSGDLDVEDEISGNTLSITGNSNFEGTVDIEGSLFVTGAIDTNTGLFIQGVDINDIFNVIQVENNKTYFNQFLTLGTTNQINGNYIGTTEFSFTNTSSTQTLFISNLILSIQDGSPFNLNNYASIGSPLTNGINVYYTTNSGATRINVIGTTFNILSNSDLNSYTNDIEITDLGTGDAVYTANINFRNNGSFIILPQNEKFSLEVQDNLSSISSHKAQISGFLYPTNLL